MDQTGKFTLISVVHGIDASGRGAGVLFGENYPKLQLLKGKYDPENIFNKWFPIAPVFEGAA